MARPVARFVPVLLLAGSASAQTEDERRVLVRCVTEDGLPVPSARIHGLEVDSWDPSGFCDAVQDLAELPRLALTDGDGRANIASGSEGFLIAESDSGRGATNLWDQPRRAEIVLWPKRSVDVEVVDGEGRPLEGVSVVVRMLTQGGGTFHWSFSAVTDVQGRCRIEGLELCARGFPGDQEYPLPVTAFDVGVGELLPRVPRQILPDEDGRHSVRLVLPPTAPLRVRCPDVEDLASVQLRCEEVGDAVGRAPVTERVAFFRHVGLDLELQATLLDGVRAGELRFAGPTDPGVLVAIELPSRVARRRVRARLTDRVGEPIVGARVALVNDRTADRSESFFETTSAEGALDVVTSRESVGIWILRSDPSGVDRVHAYFGHEALAEEVQGVLDLGIVPEGAGDGLAEGQLVDPDGAPIPRVAIRLLSARRGESFLRPEIRAFTFTGPDGRFRILGPRAGAEKRFAIEVDDAHWRSEAVEIGRDREAKTIVARPRGSISLPVPSLDIPGVGGPEATVVLYDDVGVRASSRNRNGNVNVRRPAERLHFTGLDPGEYSIGIEDGFEYARFEGLVVEGGVELRDPRLEELEPEDLANWVRLRLHGPGGAALDPDDVDVVLRDPDDPEWYGLEPTFARGRLPAAFSFPIPRGRPMVVEIHGAGCRNQRIELEGDANLDVELRAETAVRVRLHGPLPVLPEGAWLSACLIHTVSVDWYDDGGAERYWNREPDEPYAFGGPISPDDGLRLGADRPGKVELHWLVSGEVEGEGFFTGECRALGAHPLPILVLDHESEQIVELAFSDELHAKAVEVAEEVLRSIRDG